MKSCHAILFLSKFARFFSGVSSSNGPSTSSLAVGEPDIDEENGEEEEDPLSASTSVIEEMDFNQLAELSQQQSYFADGLPARSEEEKHKKGIFLLYRSYVGVDARDYADLMTDAEVISSIYSRHLHPFISFLPD